MSKWLSTGLKKKLLKILGFGALLNPLCMKMNCFGKAVFGLQAVYRAFVMSYISIS